MKKQIAALPDYSDDASNISVRSADISEEFPEAIIIQKNISGK